MNSVPIIYENNEIILVNKPSGLAVQGGEGVAHPLDDVLSEQIGKKVCLVHRLDRETAGLLVVAKNPAAAAKWTKLISGGQVHKEYNAICFGVPVIDGRKKQTGIITASVRKDGRELPAVTNFSVRKTIVVPDESAENILELSLLNLLLGTGRMHQIRIHLAQCSCPIAGDDRHGDFRMNRIAKKVCGIKRLQLAAVKITIPIGSGVQTFSVPLPDHMQAVADRFF